jgi:transposase
MARSLELIRLFEHPDSTAQRHYEICRAYFMEHLTADEVAHRFDLHVGSIRALVRDFAHDPDLGQFFCMAQAADRPAPKRESIRDRACSLRNQGLTLADIHTQLHAEGHPVSEAYLFRLLQDEGLAIKGQRCRSVRQPGDHANDGSLVPAIADVHQLAQVQYFRGMFP